MTRGGAVGRRSAAFAALGAAALALLTAGCMPSEASTRREAVRGLEDQARAVHEAMLTYRSRDPLSAGDAAVASLDEAYAFPGRQDTVHADGSFEVVVPVANRVEQGGGLFYHQAGVGGCVAMEVVPGSGDEEGRRGEVTTTAVECPAGMVPESGGYAVEVIELDIGVLRDEVPAETREPGVCFGTTGDCPGG